MYQQSFDFEQNYVVNGIRVKPVILELSRINISLMGGSQMLREFYNSLGRGDSLDSISDSDITIGSNHPPYIEGIVQPDCRDRFPDETEFWWSGSALCFKYRLAETETARLSTLLKELTMSIRDPVGGFWGTLHIDEEFMEINGTYPILKNEDVPDLQSRVQAFLATHLP